ncbi:hypothetical protein [Cryptosporangium sp. NPDC051539]|uniref:hypothetical protein n=1 Tax=Cryptosporangium sp. NPDC051539 TaxID=3363962 RepID=UPI0037B20F38
MSELLPAIQLQIDALRVLLHAQQRLLNAIQRSRPAIKPTVIVRPSPRRTRS